ncbi:hypothetical protein ACFE04_017499 [Oxalis oulophora]
MEPPTASTAAMEPYTQETQLPLAPPPNHLGLSPTGLLLSWSIMVLNLALLDYSGYKISKSARKGAELDILRLLLFRLWLFVYVLIYSFYMGGVVQFVVDWLNGRNYVFILSLRLPPNLEKSLYLMESRYRISTNYPTLYL